MSPRNRYTAFVGTRLVTAGPLEEVALEVKTLLGRDPTAAALVFDDTTGRPVDLDLRGSDDSVVRRLADHPVHRAKTPLAAGRPKLGVVAREITLLPRHWEWLAAQPGGASVALRRLVDEARHASPVADRVRRAREATYRFMTAVAGDLPRYEEAIRALFAGDGARYHAVIGDWPNGVQLYAGLLSQDAFEPEGEPSKVAPGGS
jgi:uncharacterized protein